MEYSVNTTIKTTFNSLNFSNEKYVWEHARVSDLCKIYSWFVQAINLCKWKHLIFIVQTTSPCRGKGPQTHNTPLVNLMFLSPSLWLQGPVTAMFQRLLKTCSFEVLCSLDRLLSSQVIFFFLKRLNTQSHSSDSLLENLFSHLFIFSCIPLAPELTFRWGLEPHLGDSSLGASHPYLWPPSQGHHGTMALGMPCQRLLHWDSWRSFPLILPRQPWLSAVTRGQPLFLVDCIRSLPNLL